MARWTLALDVLRPVRSRRCGKDRFGSAAVMDEADEDDVVEVDPIGVVDDDEGVEGRGFDGDAMSAISSPIREVVWEELGRANGANG